MQVKLKILSGSHSGREVTVNREKYLIGRGQSCQMRLKSESISRKHCILVVRKGKVLVQDLNSRNGTFINGNRVASDKASILNNGDQLTVGKMAFEILVEYGIGGPKKSEVADVKEAAQRMVGSLSGDSSFEDIDITSWLDEADNIERERKMGDPDTRQMKFDAAQSDTETPAAGPDSKVTGDSNEDSKGDTDEKKSRKARQKSPPQKLPQNLKKQMAESSRDAAGEALKRFFSGR